jgi:hypothetical protein
VSLNPRQVEIISARLTEAESSLDSAEAERLVLEIESAYRSHGADSGGNQYGLLGSWVALMIDKADRGEL